MHLARAAVMRLIAPWVVVDEHRVIAVSDKETALRVAQLIERHGWTDVPLDVMPDLGEQQ